MTIAIEPGGVVLGGVALSGAYDPFLVLQPVLLDAAGVFDLTLLVGTTGRTILAAAWDDTPFGAVAPDRGAGFALRETVVQLPPGEDAAFVAMASPLATPMWSESRFALAPDIFPTVVAPDRGAGFALRETVVQVPPGEAAAAMAMDTGLATPVWFEGRFVLEPDIFPTVVTSDVTRVVIGP